MKFVKNSPNFLSKSILTLSVLIIVITVSFCFYLQEKHKIQQVKSSKANAEMLSNVLADYVETKLLLTELIIDNIKEKVIAEESEENSKPITSQILKESPFIEAIIVTCAEGKIKSYYEKQDVSYNTDLLLNVGQLVSHKYYQQPYLLNIENYASKTNNEDYLILSKAIKGKNNNDLGRIVALIKSAYLHDFFDSVEVGDKAEMIIISDDKNIIFSSPDINQEVDVLNHINTTSTNLKLAIHKAYSESRYFHNYLHVFAYKHFKTLPFSVALISFEGDIYRYWLSDSQNVFLLSGVIVILLAIISYFAVDVSKKIEYAQKYDKLSIALQANNALYITKAVEQIKAPTNALIGFTELLASNYFGPLNHKQHERIKDIADCGNQILAINQFLGRAASSRSLSLAHDKELIDLSELFNQVLMTVEKDYHIKSIKLDITYDLVNPIQIRGDYFKLLIIITHFLNQAITLSPMEASVRVSISSEQEQGLVISIEDCGASSNRAIAPHAVTSLHKLDNWDILSPEILSMLLVQYFADIYNISIAFNSQDNINKTILLIPHKYIV